MNAIDLDAVLIRFAISVFCADDHTLTFVYIILFLMNPINLELFLSTILSEPRGQDQLHLDLWFYMLSKRLWNLRWSLRTIVSFCVTSLQTFSAESERLSVHTLLYAKHHAEKISHKR